MQHKAVMLGSLYIRSFSRPLYKENLRTTLWRPGSSQGPEEGEELE
jgi:hypothetical protein